MTRRHLLAMAMLAGVILTGTWLDQRARAARASRQGSMLVADLHVHPYPGDGSLTIWQLQREALRRGIDVIAITGHNNRFGLRLSRLLGVDATGPIVLPGQEVTSADFHMIAAGIDRLIDWRLPAAEAIAATHSQGGVAIAAHPIGLIDSGWGDLAQRGLDGTEVMHPLRFGYEKGARELDAFFVAARNVNPGLAPIGSTDFHMAAPLGLCRTYIRAEERTAAGALSAIREGRTAAACGDGELAGAPEHVAAVRSALASAPAAPAPSSLEKVLALAALGSLALLAIPSRQ